MTLSSKKFIKNGIPYVWPLFLLIPLIGTGLITYTMNLIHLPKSYEKIEIFVASSDVDSNGLASNIETVFKEVGMKEVGIVTSNPADVAFYEKLKVIGYNSSDLFILPASIMENLDLTEIMLPIYDLFIENELEGNTYSYFEQDDKQYGIEIKSQGSNSWLEDYIPFADENYYLTVSATSLTIESYGTHPNSVYDLSLQTMRYLLGGNND
ncbi:MAG: hypothetical protein WCX47_01935 [Bacilli bacterium]|jgi:hypothetical protein|nr:hypothetical protein [Bacilli bacterium]